MPRAKKGETTYAAHFEKEHVRNFIERIENTQDEIDGIMQKAKDDCAPLREDIASIKREAHDAGIPRLELNAKLRERRLRSSAEAVRESLTPEQQDNFDKMSQALGDLEDTPLGRAAAAREAGTSETVVTH